MSSKVYSAGTAWTQNSVDINHIVLSSLHWHSSANCTKHSTVHSFSTMMDTFRFTLNQSQDWQRWVSLVTLLPAVYQKGQNSRQWHPQVFFEPSCSYNVLFVHLLVVLGAMYCTFYILLYHMASENLTQPFLCCTTHSFLVQKAPRMQHETQFRKPLECSRRRHPVHL